MNTYINALGVKINYSVVTNLKWEICEDELVILNEDTNKTCFLNYTAKELFFFA